MKKVLLLGIMSLYLGSVYCAEPKDVITLEFSDGQSLELPLRYVPVLGGSGTLRNILRTFKETDVILIKDIGISKASFEKILPYLSVIVAQAVKGATPEQAKAVRDNLVKMLNAVDDDKALIDILITADYLDVPFIIKYASRLLARRLQQDDRLQQFVEHKEYLKQLDLSPMIAHVVAQVIMNNYGSEAVAHFSQAIDIPSKILGEHAEWVMSAAFSPDGTLRAIGSSDGTTQIWNVATGELVHALVGHTGLIVSIAFSPNGKWLATGSHDGTARIWNVSTGEAVRTLEGHAEWVMSVAFSPDENLLVTGSIDGTAQIWNLDPLLRLMSALKNMTLEQALLIMALHRYSNKGMPLNLKQYPYLEKIFNTLDPEIQKALQSKSVSRWWKWW